MIRTALLFVTLLFIASSPNCKADIVTGSRCERIVTLAPSVTEVIFALGLGQQVVGVTKYCRYPEEALAKPKIGGFLDSNTEVIYSSRPSVVFALRETEATVKRLKELGIHVVVLNHDTLSGIKESIKVVGELCGVSDKANQVVTELNDEESKIVTSVQKEQKRNALVVVGRTSEGRATTGVYISGRDGFYTEVLKLLNIENVNARQTIALPTVSLEGIAQLNPDIIVEIVNIDDTTDASELHEYWEQFPGIKAVKEKRVFFFSEDFASIPGPRYIYLAKALAQKVYPTQFLDATSH